MKKTIWFDFTNTPHVNFLYPIYRDLQGKNECIFSLRAFSETEKLFVSIFNEPYTKIGSHMGDKLFLKVLGMLQRIAVLNRKIGHFDIKLSVGGDSSNMLAKLRRKVSITFDDNEKAPNWRYSKFTDFAFWPSVIDKGVLFKQGFSKNKLYQYNGYKEDIYIADYQPDQLFLSELPFDSYVLVRPENLQANYIRNGNVRSIAPELLKLLTGKGYNVLYLPRYAFDRGYARGLKNVHIPSTPVNGLDACYFADAVLTGAGTFAREAACLGVPAISFYAGKELLTVDQSMIEKGWTFFSRNPERIVNHLPQTRRRASYIERCKAVKSEVLAKLEDVINSV